MCFKNLPIEFDEQGRARLKEAIPDPYIQREIVAKPPPQLDRGRIEELLTRNGYIQAKDFDPVTRVAGALAFQPSATSRSARSSRRARWGRCSAATR